MGKRNVKAATAKGKLVIAFLKLIMPKCIHPKQDPRSCSIKFLQWKTTTLTTS